MINMQSNQHKAHIIDITGNSLSQSDVTDAMQNNSQAEYIYVLQDVDCSNRFSQTNESSKYLVFKGNITTIGEKAFSNQQGLKTLHTGDQVTDIQDAAFSGCSGLESVNMPGVKKIVTAFFRCTALRELNLSSAEEIAAQTLHKQALPNLTTCTLPEKFCTTEAMNKLGLSASTTSRIPKAVSYIASACMLALAILYLPLLALAAICLFGVAFMHKDKLFPSSSDPLIINGQSGVSKHSIGFSSQNHTAVGGGYSARTHSDSKRTVVINI
jgi:hypothetical protein